MAKIKLTKSAVDAAQTQDNAIELRDTVVPGFPCKITLAGHQVFMPPTVPTPASAVSQPWASTGN